MLLALLLAAAGKVKRRTSAIRRLRDDQVLDVVTKPENQKPGLNPNACFWILLALESVMIVTAYVLNI